MTWFCYLIGDTTSDRTYIGVTTDVKRRLSEHGKTSKSAKYTRGREWQIILYISGFANRSLVQKFETAWKRMIYKYRTIRKGVAPYEFTGLPKTWQRRLVHLTCLKRDPKLTFHAPQFPELVSFFSAK